MNPGKVGRRGTPLRSGKSSTGCASKGARGHHGLRAASGARAARTVRIGVVMMLGAVAGLRAGQAAAQNAAMLDERVTQQSITETICRPDYSDAVSPPFDVMMAHKARLLAQHGIDPEDGADYAIDRRVPVLLGGSPDAPANLDLLPWAGASGERRKARFVVHLKHCVCAGKMSLSDAQATIAGNWSAAYAGFGRSSCNASGVDVATGGRDIGP
ncbi:hypothetical protein [Paraburkholderia phenazinium]|jgi:hypothetical protein|uniref:Uncharacterized protein n=1 Tax=Paraburkholderia phenazinium TaxID=60549 RepID=A0A1G7SUU0_9BURK|nr:hypothetical protein [Paraburkholderia phenazinium]SDG26738.1 hypothetical protein SAMN05216466_102671 [Paraburkholderia phenazinium]